MEQKAGLGGVAKGTLSLFPVYNESCYCADVKIGGSALSCQAADRKTTARWRGPAKDPRTDEAGATVKIRSPTFISRRVLRKEENGGAGCG